MWLLNRKVKITQCVTNIINQIALFFEKKKKDYTENKVIKGYSNGKQNFVC